MVEDEPDSRPRGNTRGDSNAISDLTISALLTPKQRAYLRSESDIEPKSPQERTVRSRIRDRLARSVGDMALLAGGTLEARDLTQVFERDRMNSLLAPAIALLLDGIAHAHDIAPEDWYEDSEEEPAQLTLFEDILATALIRVYRYRGVVLERLTVSIRVEVQGDVGEIPTDDLSALELQELVALHEAGEITREDVKAALEEDME